MSQEIHIFEDKIELARYFGEILVSISTNGGEKNIALSGGTTPQAIFDTLTNEFAERINWANLRLFWVDERCVAPTHPESNYGMTARHLIEKNKINRQNIYRIKGELSPTEALKDYIEVIDANVRKEKNLPLFDMVVLGMGDDGHTASIFPHEIELWKSPEICAIATHPITGQKRITLTGKTINNACQIVFLVTGKGKAEKIEQIITFDRSAAKFPARMVDSTKTIWLIDTDAASLLEV